MRKRGIRSLRGPRAVAAGALLASALLCGCAEDRVAEGVPVAEDIAAATTDGTPVDATPAEAQEDTTPDTTDTARAPADATPAEAQEDTAPDTNDTAHAPAEEPQDAPSPSEAPSVEAPYTTWDEAESPNYVRLVGPAQLVSALSPGEVAYAPLDELGRAGRVEAHVTRQMMDEGRTRQRTNPLPDPAGWAHNQEVTIELPHRGRSYHGWLYNRGHLLAKSLGGDDELHNIVWVTRMQNVGANDGQGGMALLETACRDWLDSYPEVTISYVATPLFEGSELLPRSVMVDVRSSDGAIDERVEVYNAAKGYQLDYTSGTFRQMSD